MNKAVQFAIAGWIAFVSLGCVPEQQLQSDEKKTDGTPTPGMQTARYSPNQPLPRNQEAPVVAQNQKLQQTTTPAPTKKFPYYTTLHPIPNEVGLPWKTTARPTQQTTRTTPAPTTRSVTVPARPVSRPQNQAVQTTARPAAPTTARPAAPATARPATTTTRAPTTVTKAAPVTAMPRVPASSVSAPGTNQCRGKPIGTYTWGQDLWKGRQHEILDFVSSQVGKEWACGDLYINVADYTNPERIHDSEKLVPFIKQYRQRSGNTESIVWLTYGDVVEKAGDKMVTFVDTFYNWARSIPASDVSSLGRIGISFDVEHIDAEQTKTALVKAQDLKKSTAFPTGQLLVQHTIEGAQNVVGTDYVMKYSDVALMMLYRNYVKDPTNKYKEDSNIVNRMKWFLTEQCVHCLDDAYAKSNYRAIITTMVEASCKMGEYCGKISFCAFDGPNQGAYYMWDIINQMDAQIVSTGILTQAQYNRLFNTKTLFAVHNWEWYRCYAPFSSFLSYENCAEYHNMAAGCRSQ